MNRLNGYMAGANLGHWISQYGRQGKEHFDSYIREPDIARMKGWGMDHVRMPVDYFLFEKDENPGVYDENGLQYIDNCLRWCKNNSMNLIIDLHHAPGFFFGNGDKNNLFTDREQQIRYINIWKFFAKRYSDEGDNLVFELLNELVWKDSTPWNKLWQETVEEILAISPARRIIVGGNYWNSINELKNLAISKHENVIYTFHSYEPFVFTHQRASWIESARNYTTPITYPFRTAEHIKAYNGNPPKYDVIDINYMRDYFKPAIEFISKTNRTLYCGEYGVISNADIGSTINWLKDITEIFNEYGIGHAVWSYRGFANVTDSDNNVISDEIVKVISQH